MKVSLKKCLIEDARKKNCPTCADERLNSFEKNQLALEEIKKHLLKRVGDMDEQSIQEGIVSKFRKLKPASKPGRGANRGVQASPTPAATPTPYRFTAPPIQPMVRDNTYVKPPVIRNLKVKTVP